MRHAERSEAGGARGTPHERGGEEQGRGVFEVTRARTRRLRVDAVRRAPGLAHLLERHQAAWARPDDENGRHVAEEEQELWASVWLVSDVACQQSIHAEVRGCRGALHAGACVAERGGGG